jgi:hypothetical protein
MAIDNKKNSPSPALSKGTPRQLAARLGRTGDISVEELRNALIRTLEHVDELQSTIHALRLRTM